MNKSILLLLFIFSSFYCVSQNLSNDLLLAISQKRANTYFSGTKSFEKYIQNSPEKLAELLNTYIADSSEDVRYFAYELYGEVNRLSSNANAKEQSMEKLCKALNDDSKSVRDLASGILSELPLGEFTENSKQYISTSFSDYSKVNEDKILLVGYLGLKDLEINLQQIRMDATMGKAERWAACMALARMDDDSALEFILNATKRKDINDDVIYNYFPSLIYTRRREAFDYVITELYNKDKNCQSPNPNVPQSIVCGYRVMEMLAPVIKDFPFNTTASGGIDAKDYNKALETTRKWFEKHKTDYTIVQDKF